jgi:hypothetical protein
MEIYGGSCLPLTGGTLTGAITFAPSSGTSFTTEILDITALDSNATLFRSGVGVFTGVNGTDPKPNNVWAIGWNMQNGNGPSVAGQPVVGISLERYYAAGGLGTNASELHLTSWTTGGVEQRVFTSNIRHDGSLVGTTMMADTLTLIDRSNASPFQFGIANKRLSFTLSAYQLFDVNNTAVAQQRNGAGNSFINLPYFGSDDRLIISGSFRSIADTPTTGSFSNQHAYIQSTSLAANGVLLRGLLPTVAGDANAFYFTGNVSANLFGVISNGTTGNRGARAVLQLSTTSTGGNPEVWYNNGSQNWMHGLDYTDNHFKIGTDHVGNSVKFDLDTSGNLILSGGAVFSPGSSRTPASNGQVTFELTSNTTLTFKAKGSDGTVRSGAVTLS